ncbi:MAG: helix-turn-helix domain-containing protein [Anaerolineae bacterium]|nr:helix-turn-helix domain-containing protein [Anaerolineae bacterium]
MEASEWVSLREAASILGVHPSTVRSWADEGSLPSQRTPGGHRRFRRSDLERWMNRENASAAPVTSEIQLMIQNAMGRARMEISEGQLQGLSWYNHMAPEARVVHGALSRRLLDLLTRYLSQPDDHTALLQEARALGGEYAQVCRQTALSLPDAVEAFLFFRDMMLASVVQLAEMFRLHTPADWGGRMREVNRLTDELLLGLIEAYTVSG